MEVKVDGQKPGRSAGTRRLTNKMSRTDTRSEQKESWQEASYILPVAAGTNLGLKVKASKCMKIEEAKFMEAGIIQNL